MDNFDAIGSRIRELKKIAPKKKLQTVGNEVLQAYAEGSKVVEDERHSLEVGGRYDYSKPFSEQIDDYIAGRIPKYDTLVVGGTPDVFKEIGLLSLPMTYDTNHLDEVIQGTKRDHTFGVENLKKIPVALENPIAIFASNSHPESSVVAILDLSYDNKNMFAAVEIDGFAQSNGNRINSNKLSSVYTRENAVRLLKDSVEKHKFGDVSLFYIDTKKASDFLDASEVDFLGGTSITDGFVHSIHDPGSPVNTRLKNVTYSQQFRKWFGEWRRVPEKASKVVNRDGTPRIVYHYTDGDFTVFDPSMSGNNQGKSHGDGIYVSTNPNEFSYAGKNKMELYANIRNPFEMQLTGKQADYVLDKYASANHYLDGNDGMYRAHAKSKLMTPSRVFDYLNQYADENGIKTSDILKDLGFDGVHDGSEWVAFDSNQLKSATDNIGLFGANNEDIRYSPMGGWLTCE